jgi:mRNA interferase MazF
VRRGELYDARLDPVEGSEQGGSRPVVVVSRDAINTSSPVVVVVPCTTLRPGRRIYPSHVVVRSPEGGLTADSVLLAEQVRVMDKTRLMRHRGALNADTLAKLDRALLIALDLPGQ